MKNNIMIEMTKKLQLIAFAFFTFTVTSCQKQYETKKIGQQISMYNKMEKKYNLNQVYQDSGKI